MLKRNKTGCNKWLLIFFPYSLNLRKNYYIDVALISPQGFNLSLIGDIQDKNFPSGCQM